MNAENINFAFGSPRDHAVVVGVEHYQPGIPPLQGCNNDALLFKEWLEMPHGGGLDPANIKLIYEPRPGRDRPIRDQIEDSFYEFIDRSSRQGRPIGRRLYIFMSGHGVIPPAPLHNDCGLVMANAKPDMLRALPGRLVAELVQRSAMFEEVVLFMDCCREVSGAAVIGMGLPNIMDPTINPPPPVLFAFAAKWATVAAERLLPHPFDPAKADLWQGVFTHVLLRGLTSAVDEVGHVTSLSLKDYVRRGVQELLPPEDNRRPEFYLDDDRPIDFGSGQLVDVTVRAAAGAPPFVLKGGDFAVVAPVSREPSGTAHYRVRPGLYLIDDLPAGGNRPLRIIEGPVDVSV